jgi:predicted nucleotide-binding protein (sugar kinase/HSP70/actin superfamily)
MSEDTGSRTPKIGLVGEFYLLLEPYVNYRVEDVLIKRGIEVKKFVNTGAWVYSNTLLSSLGLYNEEKAYLKQARPYLNHHVGGDGLKSVGSTLWCARNGYDGIIHLYPFGCMPEIVAQYALKNIAHDFNLPLLSLSVDEHSSDVGVLTRLEAFVDCIKRKKSVNKTESYFS